MVEEEVRVVQNVSKLKTPKIAAPGGLVTAVYLGPRFDSGYRQELLAWSVSAPVWESDAIGTEIDRFRRVR